MNTILLLTTLAGLMLAVFWGIVWSIGRAARRAGRRGQGAAAAASWGLVLSLLMLLGVAYALTQWVLPMPSNAKAASIEGLLGAAVWATVGLHVFAQLVALGIGVLGVGFALRARPSHGEVQTERLRDRPRSAALGHARPFGSTCETARFTSW
jgi:hypothetical protein